MITILSLSGRNGGVTTLPLPYPVSYRYSRVKFRQ